MIGINIGVRLSLESFFVIADKISVSFSLAFIAVIFSYFYFSVIELFLKEAIYNRLTKVSFELDIASIIELTMSYFITLILYLLIYSYIPNETLTSYSSMFIVFFGLALVYLGRVITKFKGIFYARIYYSAFFVSALLLVISNSFLSISASVSFYDWLTFFSQSFDNFIYIYGNSIRWSFFGSLFLATIGELFLSLNKNENKSLISISELFPSDFEIITGLSEDLNINKFVLQLKGKHSGLEDKLKELLGDKEFSHFSCATRSLWIIELIEMSLIKNNLIINKRKSKILKASYDSSMRAYEVYLDSRDPSPDYLFGNKNKKIIEFCRKYNYRN